MSGEACVAGTRIPVHMVLACVGEGWDEARIYREYPTLPQGAVRAVAGFAAWYLSEHSTEVAAPLRSTAVPQTG